MTKFESSINKLLAEWNPIGVPNQIALSEYSTYVPIITKAYDSRKDLQSIHESLIGVYTEHLGYDLNERATNAIQKLSERIFFLFRENDKV
jgi:hypothetical protein